jgi:hypothetical protein
MIPTGACTRPDASGNIDEVGAARRVVVEVEGKKLICYTVGALAEAVHRSVHQILIWERCKFLPPPPITIQPNGWNTRLYRVQLIWAVADLAERENYGRRLRSDQFDRQQRLLLKTWNAVMNDLLGEIDGVIHLPKGARQVAVPRS